EIGLLATIGKKLIKVAKQPRVAILATGDELVDAGDVPGPSQIRDSNSPTLFSLLQSAGAEPFKLDLARDDRNEIERLIKQGLRYDVLLLTGGVSTGTADFVPQTLAKLGVEEVFHKV